MVGPSCVLGVPKTPSPLLGTGRGVDHFIVAVRDLRQASADYGKLGFEVTPGGKHPGGTQNDVARFGKHQYLELLSVYDESAQGGREIAEFLSRGDGAAGAGLETSSADQTTAHLRGRGLEVGGPRGGTITYEGIEETPPVLWRFVEWGPSVPYLSDFVFFLEYDRKAHAAFVRKYPDLGGRSKPPHHPNGARGFNSFWLAVDSLESAARSYASAGFPVGPEMAIPPLRSTGREVEAGEGSILLLQSDGGDGPVPEVLRLRKAPAALMGVSIQVDHLDSARAVLPAEVPRRAGGTGGERGSILIPPEFAHGVWIELTGPADPD